MTQQPSHSAETDEPQLPDRLVTIAAQLFSIKGYHATTTRELSEEMGLTKSTLYHYIEGKEDVLFAICMQAMQRISLAARQAVEEQSAADEKIAAFVRAHMMTLLTDQAENRVMLVELRNLTGAAGAKVRAQRREYEQFLADLMDSAQRQAILRDDVSSRLLSLELLGMMNWTTFWYSAKTEAGPAEIADLYVTLFFNGAMRPDHGG